jgi:putative SOS response-associated peptidase YedK
MAVLAIGVSRAERRQEQPYFIRRADDDPMVFAGARTCDNRLQGQS